MLKKGDIYMVAAALAVAALIFIGYELYASSGGDKIAIVIQDGKVVKRIDLSKVEKPEELLIKGTYSDTLLVEKGRIRFEKADCPNKDCVRTGWISEKGAIAVCLPNKVMVKIESSGEQQIDGGTY